MAFRYQKPVTGPYQPPNPQHSARVNILGQPIVAESAKPAVAAKPPGGGLMIRSGANAGKTTVQIAKENAALQAQADAADSPRSKAAKLMKRQAGIGQLKTMHVEEPDL